MSESEMRKLLAKIFQIGKQCEGSEDVVAVGKFMDIQAEFVTLFRTRPSSPGEAWIPIWNPPAKDGDYLIVGGRGQAVAFYDVDRNRWTIVPFEKSKCEITHWMPLPPPPSESGGEAERNRGGADE